jgi:large subunit ribosomal protein L31
MQASIHPDYQAIKVTCSCGNIFETRSTLPGGALSVEVCSNCHPFYTGQQKTAHTSGRIQRFRERYGMNKDAEEANKAAGGESKT